MTKYENGKIYTIRSYQTDKYYIGSTCSPLSKRLYQHRTDYRQYQKHEHRYVTSCEIIKYDDHYIELLEKFPCSSKNELLHLACVCLRLARASLAVFHTEAVRECS